MTTSETSQLFSQSELTPAVDYPDAVLDRARTLLAELESELAGVERALANLEHGTYGRCEVCNEEIDGQRMAEEPATTRCATHAAQVAVAGAPIS